MLPGYSGPSLGSWAMYTLAQPQQPQESHQESLNNIPLGQEQTDNPGQLGTRKISKRVNTQNREGEERGDLWQPSLLQASQSKTFLKQPLGGLGV